MKKTRNCGKRPWVGPDGLGCGIIRRLIRGLIGNAAPKGAAFFLRVAKDEMQWQRYVSRITARFLAVARACHVNSVAILSRDLRTSSRTRRSAPCCGQLGLHVNATGGVKPIELVINRK